MLDHMLRASLETGRTIMIIYHRDSRFTEREIRVTGIGSDYVTAYCYLRNQRRTFRKDKILAAAFCSKQSA